MIITETNKPKKKHIITVVVAGNFLVIGAFSQIDGPTHLRVTAATNNLIWPQRLKES